MDCIQRQFEAVGDAELVKNVVEVILYGLLADDESYADFLVVEALANELDDFLLAVADERLSATWSGFGSGEGVDHFGVLRLSNQISPACTRRMLFSSTSVADCFRITPRAPRRMARITSRSSQNDNALKRGSIQRFFCFILFCELGKETVAVKKVEQSLLQFQFVVCR